MTATSASSATSMQTRGRPWWLTLIMGITVFVLGAVLLWAPAKDKMGAYRAHLGAAADGQAPGRARQHARRRPGDRKLSVTTRTLNAC